MDSAKSTNIDHFSTTPDFEPFWLRFWYHFGLQNVKKSTPGQFRRNVLFWRDLCTYGLRLLVDFGSPGDPRGDPKILVTDNFSLIFASRSPLRGPGLIFGRIFIDFERFLIIFRLIFDRFLLFFVRHSTTVSWYFLYVFWHVSSIWLYFCRWPQKAKRSRKGSEQLR